MKRGEVDINEKVLQDSTEKALTEECSPEPTHTRRPVNPRSNTSLSMMSTDDDDYLDDKIIIDDGVPSDIPLEALAGPALILPANDLDVDGHTLTEEFDWGGKDEDDDEEDGKEDEKGGALSQSGVFICLSKNSSHIAWFCIVLFALILIAIDVAIFVVYEHRISITSYNLELWFTWLAFLWCIGFLSQIFVELVPWAIRKSVSYVRPQSIEVLRMRLSYYKALRPYIKLLLISAWNWGSWAFIKDHVPLPVIGQDEYGFNVYQSKPSYTSTFFSIWECIFFASLFLFIEKFILQLIVTSFHKKAYGDRIKENDRALRILDKLRKTKKKNPQEFLLKRIRRKNKTGTNLNGSGTNTNVPSRSHSLDDSITNSQTTKPIINQQQHVSDTNVKFPAQNMDTLIAIPPLEDRIVKSEDEKQDILEEEVMTEEPQQQQTTPEKKKNMFNKFTNKMRRQSSSQQQDTTVLSGDESGYTTPNTLTRENTWFTRNSQDEKGFFGATRDFKNSTAAIPGKLLKGGYNKFVSQTSTTKRNSYNQAQNSTKQAKYLAKKIFNNLIGPDSNRDAVVESDFYPFFRTVKEASYAFDLFDTDGNGDLSKRELRSGCIRIYRERKNLTRSMRDLSQATGKLDILLMIIFTVVWVVIVCAAFGVNVGTDLMPLWSAFVAASFIFGTSAKDAFEAIIFVFITHPFDSGDRVLIGTENWVVQNVGLLVTTFIKWDGSIVYAKNSVLTTQYIINVRRSGRTGETIELQVSFSTPSWKIKKLTEHMINWTNQFPKLYTTNSASVNVTSFQNQNICTLSLYFEHTQNWQDAGGRWLRHNNFMFELKEECERLGISYSLPNQPYTEVNANNDAPPEAYNMGSKSSYGLDGMTTRRPYEAEHDDDGYINRPIGGESSGSNHSGGGGTDSGAMAGTAATMMFAASM